MSSRLNTAKGLVAGNVQLRPGKRPRPIALRLNVGDCLQVNFTNLLAPDPANVNSFAANNAPATRTASTHIMGLQLVGTILSDGSNVGQNQSSLVAPGASATYTYMAQREGNHLIYSTAATTGGEGDGGSLAMGLFGSVNVEVKTAEWYRSQLTAEELALATAKNADGTPKKTAAGQPILNYDAVYPAGHPRAGQPIVKMLDANNNIVHTDLNAVITGPNKGRFRQAPISPTQWNPIANSRFASLPSSITTRSKQSRPSRSLKIRSFRTRFIASKTALLSTTAPAALARKFSRTVLASARWRTALNVSTKTSSCRRGL